MRYLLGLYFHHYGKVDVTMEICAAAEKQQWTVEAGSMAEQTSILGFSFLFWFFLCFSSK